jgi:archaeosortase B (VPXXXP-CTERM-specific)
MYRLPRAKKQTRTSWWRRLHPAVLFIVLFVVLLLVFSVVYAAISAVFNDQMILFMAATARLVGSVLSLGGMEISLQGRFISAPNIAIEIIEECTGIYEIVIFIAAALAYPASRREKLIGVIGGAIVLYSLNIVRMVLLVVVGNIRPDWFDFFHIYFWQVTMILMIASVWLLWILKVVRHVAHSRAARA